MSPPLGHEPPQSRRRNPLTPFGPAGQYRLTNGWPWCSHPATAKGESVYEDFAQSATVVFLFASGRIRPGAAEISADHQPGTGRGTAEPKAHRRQAVGQSPVGAAIVLGAIGSSRSRQAEAGFDPIHFTESTRHINVTLVALAISAVSTHLATANVQFGEGQPSTGRWAPPRAPTSGTWLLRRGSHGWEPAGSPFAKSCPRHWGTCVPPTGHYRPGCRDSPLPTNRGTADSGPTDAARWSPLLQMMIEMVRGRPEP